MFRVLGFGFRVKGLGRLGFRGLQKGVFAVKGPTVSSANISGSVLGY